MALDTYANLQTSIISWAMRSGETEFAAQVPDFITLTETMLNYGEGDMMPLRVAEMETFSTLTLASGSVSLPADYLEYRDVYSTASGQTQSLTYGTPSELEVRYSGISGSPSRFTIKGSSLICYPTSDGTTVGLSYYAKIPALSNSNTTNWLLTKAPNVYLYGSLVQAAPYMMDDARIQTWMQLYERAITGLLNTDRRSRYSRTSVNLSGPTP